jgi:hypothetical protein
MDWDIMDGGEGEELMGDDTTWKNARFPFSTCDIEKPARHNFYNNSRIETSVSA